MLVLGLNISFHDTAACLVKDGAIVAAIEEERLNREKHTGKYPIRAIKYCLREAKANIKDIDLVVQDLYEVEKDKDNAWRELIEEKWEILKGVKRIRLRHHLGHAAAVYYTSGFDEAAILTTDGGGSRGLYGEIIGNNRWRERQAFWRGQGKDIIEISTVGSTEYGNYKPWPLSLGMVYESLSELLGYGLLEGPGKAMGLSSYGSGRIKRNIKDFYLEFPNGHWLFLYQHIGFAEHIRRKDEAFTEDHKEIAYLIQQEVEDAMVSMANTLHRITGSYNLCIGGGVGLNCPANRKIYDKTEIKNIAVYPASADNGIAVGNALYGYYNILKGTVKSNTVYSPYLGCNYAKEEIEKAIQGVENIKVEYFEDREKYYNKCAELISSGRILGWFNGRSEIGPRALGNRSILADPRNPDMKDILNNRVKHRESYRPFAPAVLEEDYKEYFDLPCISPFMLLIGKTHPGIQDIIPSVTHVDGTARVQTVNAEQNYVFYSLIKAFKAITGVGVVLNTSFNDVGEPIVEKPIDAMRCFLKTGIDVLAIEGYLIEKI